MVHSAAAISIGAGIEWALQHLRERVAVWRMPLQLAFCCPRAGTEWQLDVVRDEVAQHAIDRATALEGVEHQTNHGLDLLVIVEDDRTNTVAHVAARQVEQQLAPRGLGAASLQHSGLEHMQLRLADRAFQAKQKPVIKSGWIVHAVSVCQERPEQGADLQQLVPVPTGARQARHLHAEYQPDMAQTDLGHQALEPWTVCRRAAGAAQVIVDDLHPLAGPAELKSTFDQTILKPCGFLVLLDLPERGLPDIDGSRAEPRTGFGCRRLPSLPSAA